MPRNRTKPRNNLADPPLHVIKYYNIPESDPVSTVVKCTKCIHHAVFGQENCPEHGGIVPRTIAEYESRKDNPFPSLSKIAEDDRLRGPGVLVIPEEISGSLSETDWSSYRNAPIVPRNDSLEELREKVREKLAAISFDPEDGDFEEGWHRGITDGYREVLSMIDSMIL